MQKEVIINEMRIPMIEEGGEKWYPISCIGSKVLLKDLSPSQLRTNGYGEYISQFNIDFGENIGGIQFTYCISELGLTKILSNSKIGRLSVEQKVAMNSLLEYLGIQLICIDERFTYDIPKEMDQYSEYIQDCINDVCKDKPNIMWQKCSKCNKYYPYHINFYRENPHSGKNYKLYTFCRDCCGWDENRSKDWIRRNDNDLSNIYREEGTDTYILYKKHDTIGIYNNWINKQYSKFTPKIIHNKNDYLIIIKYLYENGLVDKDNLTVRIFDEEFKLTSVKIEITSDEMYNYIFGDEPYNYPWKFKNYSLPNNTSFEQQKIIFNNYLESNNINICDKYIFDYNNICYNCGLKTFALHDILKFVMNYYDNELPSYRFNIGSINYWKVKEHRIKALKYLIEQDMKIPIEKVPLYLTLENLRKQSNTMRNLLKKYYDNNMWNWVNELYPDRFDEEDFNVTVIRNVFDSAEESLVHDILVNRFKNVLYNQRGTKNTISLMDMQPDWFIFTNSGIWVVEYFGISVDQNVYNKRVADYKKKTLSKIEKYKELDWLRTVYVYPEDLKDNFKGLGEKLDSIE